jgi:neurotransmitter:Na+ symporter, NSS family
MTQQREHWGSQLGFILAAAGSAIGLGTLWMFPYVTGSQGGGLFVLLYILFTFVIGIPVFIGEVLLGRKAQKSPVGIFESLTKSRKWNITGWMGVASAFFILCYYIVVAGWSLNYILMSLCQFWNFHDQASIANTFNIIDKSGDITLFWQWIFLFITTKVVYQGVKKGIEKWSKVMTISLFLILLGLFFYGLSLEGFPQAWKFIFYPNYADFKPSAALEALGLSFFTLSLGQGIMFTYGSYTKDSSDIPKIACIIAFVDIIISLLAALTIFPILFTFGLTPDAGPGLVFKTLPLVFSQMPGALLLSIAFFTLLVFTALTSSIALLEVVIAHAMERYHWSRKRAALTVSIIIGIVSIPCGLSNSGGLFPQWQAIYGKNFFETLNTLVSNWLLPLGGLATALYIGWSADRNMILKEFCKGSKLAFIFPLWHFSLRWVTPIAIFLLIFHKSQLIDINFCINWLKF